MGERSRTERAVKKKSKRELVKDGWSFGRGCETQKRFGARMFCETFWREKVKMQSREKIQL